MPRPKHSSICRRVSSLIKIQSVFLDPFASVMVPNEIGRGALDYPYCTPPWLFNYLGESSFLLSEAFPPTFNDFSCSPPSRNTASIKGEQCDRPWTSMDRLSDSTITYCEKTIIWSRLKLKRSIDRSGVGKADMATRVSWSYINDWTKDKCQWKQGCRQTDISKRW